MSQKSRIDRRLTGPPIQNANEQLTALKQDMQIDVVSELPPSGGYENIVTAMDVFSRSLVAYTTPNEDAKSIAKVINDNMTQHAYLPTALNSDKA